MATRFVAINDIGRRIGQSHHNAKLTDHEVELLLQCHESGQGYRVLAATFEISRSLARKICKGQVRNQTVAGHIKVDVREASSPPDLNPIV